MIELIFVIVVLGILSAIAIPRFAATRDDAHIAKGRSDVAAIRSAIITERQTRLLRGDSSYITSLDGASTSLFDGNDSTHVLLQYPIIPQNTNGHWRKTAANTYAFKVMNVDTTFTYTPATGRFDCAGSGYCSDLTQ